MINYFKIFELPITFDIDLHTVESSYLEFQKTFHPDNAALADIEKSININKAYEVLIAPISRASHILQLNNIDLEDDSKAPKPDMSTLEEILELQEQVAEIEMSQTTDLKKKLDNAIADIMKHVEQSLKENQFDIAAQHLMKAKYFDKTRKDLRIKKRSLNS